MDGRFHGTIGVLLSSQNRNSCGAKRIKDHQEVTVFKIVDSIRFNDSCEDAQGHYGLVSWVQKPTPTMQIYDRSA